MNRKILAFKPAKGGREQRKRKPGKVHNLAQVRRERERALQPHDGRPHISKWPPQGNTLRRWWLSVQATDPTTPDSVIEQMISVLLEQRGGRPTG